MITSPIPSDRIVFTKTAELTTQNMMSLSCRNDVDATLASHRRPYNAKHVPV